MKNKNSCKFQNINICTYTYSETIPERKRSWPTIFCYVMRRFPLEEYIIQKMMAQSPRNRFFFCTHYMYNFTSKQNIGSQLFASSTGGKPTDSLRSLHSKFLPPHNFFNLSWFVSLRILSSAALTWLTWLKISWIFHSCFWKTIPDPLTGGFVWERKFFPANIWKLNRDL